MEASKKVVDLIYIEPQLNDKALAETYKRKLDVWSNKLKTMQESYFEQHFDSGSADVLEIMNMRKFLKKFLQQRLTWITDSVKNQTLRKKYLKVLPPFNQKGEIKPCFCIFIRWLSQPTAT